MEGVDFDGDFLTGHGLQISIVACNGNSTDGPCKTQDQIDLAAESTMMLTYASQNFFNVESYSDPIEKEIGLMGIVTFDPDMSISTIVTVEYSEVELFDSQFRIFDDLPETVLEYASAHYHSTTSVNPDKIPGTKSYS